MAPQKPPQSATSAIAGMASWGAGLRLKEGAGTRSGMLSTRRAACLKVRAAATPARIPRITSGGGVIPEASSATGYPFCPRPLLGSGVSLSGSTGALGPEPCLLSPLLALAISASAPGQEVPELPLNSGVATDEHE